MVSYILFISSIFFLVVDPSSINIIMFQADTDRLSFLSEWHDPFSSVNWKFTLFFYPSDKTVELVSSVYFYFKFSIRLLLFFPKIENIV